MKIHEIQEVAEVVEVVEGVNLTPHELAIIADDGFVIRIQPTGDVARCATTETPVRKICFKGFEAHPVTVSRTVFGSPSGVPEAEVEKVYLTSTLVKEAMRRDDVLAPGKGVRDEGGKVYAAQGLACV